ncbi:hypothetical protein [Arthrobacter sp. NEB 688]|uniref:hypothetical protein n=1 Tax=Arthrobacter sp. NEB 688 TaxID=904039 RepID=UPI001566CE19|nr:hypothetical protein [Arthrobacter sp. NEB 688]QKE84314.1 hypothetical protein HL663_10445 [Arthrobacter sp. NEB 688]
MATAGTPVVRAARAATATLAVLGVSAGAHQLGGGQAPGAAAFVVLALVLGPALWVVAGRRLTAAGVLAVLASSQVVVHLGLLSMAPGHGTASAAHLHGEVLAVPGSAMPPMTHLEPRMLLAHVAATLALTLLLSRAEDALWHVLSALLPPAAAPLRSPLVPRLAVPVAVVRPLGRSPRPVGGRAPPLGLC